MKPYLQGLFRILLNLFQSMIGGALGLRPAREKWKPVLFQMVVGRNENLLKEFKSVPTLRPPVCQSAGWRLQFKVSPTFLWPRNLYEIILPIPHHPHHHLVQQ